jgi:hypothetical protein
VFRRAKGFAVANFGKWTEAQLCRWTLVRTPKGPDPVSGPALGRLLARSECAYARALAQKQSGIARKRRDLCPVFLHLGISNDIMTSCPALRLSVPLSLRCRPSTQRRRLAARTQMGWL